MDGRHSCTFLQRSVSLWATLILIAVILASVAPVVSSGTGRGHSHGKGSNHDGAQRAGHHVSGDCDRQEGRDVRRQRERTPTLPGSKFAASRAKTAGRWRAS